MSIRELSPLHALIADWVPPGSRVLDLGCGDGSLLYYLMHFRACSGYGIELNDDKLQASMAKGLPVLQLNLEDGLALFADQSFDVVLQINTLQHLRNAQTMLRETARVGRRGIVAFPNFAHWPNRLSILRGHMPVTKSLPYEWYDTPNIRVGTFADFADLARRSEIQVLDSFGAISHPDGRCEAVRWLPNWRANTAVYSISR